MASPSQTPSAEEIIEAIAQADRADIQRNYYRIIKVMQERMSQDQEPFK